MDREEGSSSCNVGYFLFLVYVINKKHEIVRSMERRCTQSDIALFARTLSQEWPGMNVRYAQVIGQYYTPKVETSFVSAEVLTAAVNL